MVERMIGQKHGTGGSLGVDISRGRSTIVSSPNFGKFVRYLGEGYDDKGRRRRTPLASFRSSHLHVLGEPFDGSGAAASESGARRYWEEWAARWPEAWERWLPRIAEIADGIGAIIGAPPAARLLGTERFGAPSRNRDLFRFSRRTQRSRVRVAAVPVADLCVARMGALRRRRSHRGFRRRANRSYRAHRGAHHRADRYRGHFTCLLRIGCPGRRSHY